MLGGADNPNGELPSYITGADIITETVRKMAMQITRRGMYQRLLKVDPLKCILCGGQMRFTELKRDYRLTELVLMHEPLAQLPLCG